MSPFGFPVATAVAFHVLVFTPAASGQRPWEEKMQEFEQQDAKDPAAPGGVVFVGSSSIRLWDLDASFGAKAPFTMGGPIHNRGFGGSEISHSVDQIELLVLKHRPRLVLLYAGDNDIKEGKSAQRVSNDYDRFVAAIHGELPKTRIGFISIKPSLARWKLADTMRDANQRIAKRCTEDDRLVFIDIWTPMLGADGRPRPELFDDDGLHLNGTGYRLWAGVIHETLKNE